MISMRCPACKRVLHREDARAGMVDRCQACGAGFRVPAKKTAPTQDDESRVDSAGEVIQEVPADEVRVRRRKQAADFAEDADEEVVVKKNGRIYQQGRRSRAAVRGGDSGFADWLHWLFPIGDLLESLDNVNNLVKFCFVVCWVAGAVKIYLVLLGWLSVGAGLALLLTVFGLALGIAAVCWPKGELYEDGSSITPLYVIPVVLIYIPLTVLLLVKSDGPFRALIGLLGIVIGALVGLALVMIIYWILVRICVLLQSQWNVVKRVALVLLALGMASNGLALLSTGSWRLLFAGPSLASGPSSPVGSQAVPEAPPLEQVAIPLPRDNKGEAEMGNSKTEKKGIVSVPALPPAKPEAKSLPAMDISDVQLLPDLLFMKVALNYRFTSGEPVFGTQFWLVVKDASGKEHKQLLLPLREKHGSIAQTILGLGKGASGPFMVSIQVQQLDASSARLRNEVISNTVKVPP
jgi:hypothetical protein